jgi:glucosamine 6-phosphate synthetase-like amidotransferase/phosphosugar isomerase protein
MHLSLDIEIHYYQQRYCYSNFQSGETADTLAIIKLAKEKGAFVFGVCNVVGSSISRETHVELIRMPEKLRDQQKLLQLKLLNLIALHV